MPILPQFCYYCLNIKKLFSTQLFLETTCFIFSFCFFTWFFSCFAPVRTNDKNNSCYCHACIFKLGQKTLCKSCLLHCTAVPPPPSCWWHVGFYILQPNQTNIVAQACFSKEPLGQGFNHQIINLTGVMSIRSQCSVLCSKLASCTQKVCFEHHRSQCQWLMLQSVSQLLQMVYHFVVLRIGFRLTSVQFSHPGMQPQHTISKLIFEPLPL